jgi:hypothetical protein
MVAVLVDVGAGEGCSENVSLNKGCYKQDFSGNWITVGCKAGYVLTSDGLCVSPCPAGQFLFGSSCRACASHCDECFGPNPFQCSKCSDRHALNSQNVCSRICDRTDQFGTPDGCFDCDGSCSACFSSSESACTACPLDTGGSTGSYSLRVEPLMAGKTNTGYCLKDAGIGYTNFFRPLPFDSIVVQCPIGCLTCLDRFTCTQCGQGYFLHPPAGSGAQYAVCLSDR